MSANYYSSKITYVVTVEDAILGGEPTRRGLRHNVPPSAVEGIDWIRGWHAVDSQDAQAMLAAWKLSRSARAMDLHVADGLFIRGKMSQEAWRLNLDQWDAEFEAGERDR